MRHVLWSVAIALIALAALSAAPADAQGANTVYRNFGQKGSPCPPNSTPVGPSVAECVCNAGFSAGADGCHRVAFAQASASAEAQAGAGEPLGEEELQGDRPVVWCDRLTASAGDLVSCELRGVEDVEEWAPGWSVGHAGRGDAGRPIGPTQQPDFTYQLGGAGSYSIQLRLEHQDHPGRFYRTRSWNIDAVGGSRISGWVRFAGAAAITAIAATAVCRKVC